MIIQSIDLFHAFRLPLTNPILIFSLILFIIFLSPIILSKIRVPGIIGLIISGVIIGPYGLNLIANDSAIKLFSTIGLLYIMFIAGLELDMNEFNRNRNKSVIYGLLNFVTPPLLGFPLCYWGLGYSVTASLLLSCMLMTHTLVSYPIVSRFGLAKDQSVIVTVGGTVLTDTVVLVLLALIMEYDKGITAGFFIELMVSLSVYIFLMFWSIPRIAKWFFSKISNEGYSMYTFVLLVLFLASFLAEVAGLEPIIGAFIAGLAINRQIPHSSVLMNRIEFIGNSLFIPFFLISVGMLVNLRVLFSGTSTLLLTVGLTFVAIVSKWLVAFFAQKFFSYSHGQRNLIFGLSSAHAAATLAIILVGYRANVLNDTALNATVLLILITCVLASFVTEHAGRQVTIVSQENNVPESKHYIPENQHILVPISNLESLPILLEIGLLIKEKLSKHPITLLSVVPNDEQAEDKIKKLKHKLQNYIHHVNALDMNVAIQSTISHNVPGAVSRISRETLSDIIILGWPQNVDMIDKFIGDMVDKIVLSAKKTTMICGMDMKNIVLCKRMFVICPEYSEYEEGFEQWIRIVGKLSKELSLHIQLVCCRQTFVALQKLDEIYQLNLSISAIFSEHPEDLSMAQNYVKNDHLIVLITSRKGYVSYNKGLDHLPSKIQQTYPGNPRLIVYVKQNEDRDFSYLNID